MFIAIPNTGNLRTELVQFLLNKKFANHLFMPQAKPHDYCRNIIVNEFLKSKEEYLLMIDSDVIPPDDIFKMKDNNVDICGAHVCISRGNEIIPVGMTKNKEGYHHDFKHSKPALHKVDAVGTGCIMIHRRVLEELGKPYFSFVYDGNGFLINGEDFSFCEKAKEKGFDIYFDGRYRCKHLVQQFI